jgi:hypothetical protein
MGQRLGFAELRVGRASNKLHVAILNRSRSLTAGVSKTTFQSIEHQRKAD